MLLVGNISDRLWQETDLLFSPSSVLLPALPFVILSQYSNYIASITLSKEPPPTGLQLTKWHFSAQIEEMNIKLHEVKELGRATAEEWFKGLTADASETATDVARWETWELGGGLQSVAREITHMNFSQSSGHEAQRRRPPLSEIEGRSGPAGDGTAPDVQTPTRTGEGMFNSSQSHLIWLFL